MIKLGTNPNILVTLLVLIAYLIIVDSGSPTSTTTQDSNINLELEPRLPSDETISNISLINQLQDEIKSANNNTNTKSPSSIVPSSALSTENYKSILPSLQDQLTEHASGPLQTELNKDDIDIQSNANITRNEDTKSTHYIPNPTTSLSHFPSISSCRGRLKLTDPSGTITDGPSFYNVNLQCSWIIDSGNSNNTIRIQIHRFNTECNYDYLYIFDGDSIYSPMVAALSGDIRDFSPGLSVLDKYSSRLNSNNIYAASFGATNETATIIKQLSNTTINNDTQDGKLNSSTKDTTKTSIPISILSEIPTEYRAAELTTTPWISPDVDEGPNEIEFETHSGKAFIYFHSDTAQSMPGFYMTYSINSCPQHCSDHGDCDLNTLKCKCHDGYHGHSCRHLNCPKNCTSAQHGSCHMGMKCICKPGFMGSDCSIQMKPQTWQIVERYQARQPKNLVRSSTGRALHQSVVVGNKLWLVGGKTRLFGDTSETIHKKFKSIMLRALNLDDYSWSKTSHIIGITNLDHLAELAGHSAVAYGKKIYIYGGLALNYTIHDTLTVFDTETMKLEVMKTSTTTTKRSNDYHIHGNNFSLKEWPTMGLWDYEKVILPIASVGHSANIINDHMYIFMGFNPIYGYLNVVQKLNLKDGNWTIMERKSAQMGSIGHSTSYDPKTEMVYLYGGVNTRGLDDLFAYDYKSDIWHHLQSGPARIFYHKALILDRQLVIFGGNINNFNTASSDRCFQDRYLIYDLNCASRQLGLESETSLVDGYLGPRNGLEIDKNEDVEPDCDSDCWTKLRNSQQSGLFKRHGHSMAIHNNELILTGGFNGVLLDDVLISRIGYCKDLTNENDCNRLKLAIECSWNVFDSKCENRQDMIVNSSSSSGASGHQQNHNHHHHHQQHHHNQNPRQHGHKGSKTCANKHSESASDLLTSSIKDQEPLVDIPCNQRHSCNICTASKCIWCSTTEQCLDSQAYFAYHPIGQCMHYVAHPLKCPVASCSDIESCDACLANPRCGWLNDIGNTGKGKCLEGTSAGPSLSASSSSPIDELDFDTEDLGSPEVNSPLKVEPSSTTTTTTTIEPSSSLLSSLISLTTDRFLSGRRSVDYSTSMNRSTSSSSNKQFNLMIPNWFYSSCPACQCNGHSYCRSSSSSLSSGGHFVMSNMSDYSVTNGGAAGFNDVCAQPCQDNTEGAHCERCQMGYYGDPINGGSCKPCKCNGHAHSCNRETGKCYCSTKGIIGHNCNRCDEMNHYIGDPSNGSGNGTCYYNLTTDFQYTFNMSKTEDHFYSDINFVNKPTRRDSDVDFTIACSKPALINITSGTSYKTRKTIFSDKDCGTIRLRLTPDKQDLLLGHNYSFYVHVQKFQTPFLLQISFSQHRTIYLPQLFFTFSSCFLFFFILSGILWKLKIEYDSYVRRQRQSIEMQQMASRPFARILLDMFGDLHSPSKMGMTKVPTSEPTPVAFEPCAQHNNIGIMSVFVQLPGRPNLAVGSALVNLADPGDDLQQSQHQTTISATSPDTTNVGLPAQASQEACRSESATKKWKRHSEPVVEIALAPTSASQSNDQQANRPDGTALDPEVVSSVEGRIDDAVC